MPCTTHHHACDCREAYFAELERKLTEAKEAWETVAAMIEGPDWILEDADCRVHMKTAAYHKLDELLGGE